MRPKNLEIDLRRIICKTFYEFAKKEPAQFQDANWQDSFTYWRFDRASMIAVDNILKEYDVMPCK